MSEDEQQASAICASPMCVFTHSLVLFSSCPASVFLLHPLSRIVEVCAAITFRLWRPAPEATTWDIEPGARRGAIAVANGGCHVTAHLCAAQHARPATACSLLQRGRCAVPSSVPPLDGSPSSLDMMATSKSTKAASIVVWRVLKEDVMLGKGVEMRHREAGEKGKEEG